MSRLSIRKEVLNRDVAAEIYARFPSIQEFWSMHLGKSAMSLPTFYACMRAEESNPEYNELITRAISDVTMSDVTLTNDSQMMQHLRRALATWLATYTEDGWDDDAGCANRVAKSAMFDPLIEALKGVKVLNEHGFAIPPRKEI